MPLILAVGLVLGIALAQPRMYESSARILFDGPASTGSAAGQPSTSAAEREAAILRQLLHSRTFCVKVGRRGPLAAYLEQGTTIPANIVSALGARLGFGRFSGASGSLDDRIYEVLSRKVDLTTTGRQVVAIRFSAPDPAIAQGTVRALIDEFSDEVAAGLRAQAQTAVEPLQKKVKAYAAEVSAMNAAVAKYQAAHPKSGASDPNLVALQNAAQRAGQLHDQSLAELERAKSEASGSQAAGAGFRSIDPPNLPDRPIGFIGALLRALAAALLAGLCIAGLTLVTLAATDASFRRREKAPHDMGLVRTG
jgi:uncharacterized protein involved in exopolysaccharide biosynthesis